MSTLPFWDSRYSDSSLSQLRRPYYVRGAYAKLRRLKGTERQVFYLNYSGSEVFMQSTTIIQSRERVCRCPYKLSAPSHRYATYPTSESACVRKCLLIVPVRTHSPLLAFDTPSSSGLAQLPAEAFECAVRCPLTSYELDDLAHKLSV
jgi:hypothetical protein